MPEEFDPYRKWLGINDPARPPNYYRLLGLDLFESDPDVISHAADRQMAHVRTFQSSQHGPLSQRLLNELAAARVGLLAAEKKVVYDARLRSEIAAREPPTVPPAASPPPATSPPPVTRPVTKPVAKAAPGAPPVQSRPTAQPPVQSTPVQSASSSSSLLLLIGAAAMLAIVAVVAVGLMMQPSAPQVVQATPPEVTSAPPPAPAETPEEPAPMEPATPSPVAESSPSEAPVPPAEMPEAEIPEIPAIPPAEPSSETAPNEPPTPEPPTPEPPPPPAEPPPAEPMPPAETPLPAKLPVPSADEQAQARKLLLEVYAAQLDAAKEAQDKLRLADEFTRRAGDEQTAAAERYVLLDEAVKLALAAGDGRVALDRLSDQAARFEFDASVRQLEILEILQTSARAPGDRIAVAELALALADEAADALQVDHALALVDLARRVAARARDGDLNKRIAARKKELEQTQAAVATANEARAALERDSGDTAAHLTLGLFLCLEQNDWPQGLAHLAQCADEPTRTAAAAEIAGADTPEKQAALGDAWWDAAEATAAAHKDVFRGRAEHWYRTALPALTGLAKTKIENRLAETAGHAPKAENAAARDSILAKLERAKKDYQATRAQLRELLLGDLKQKGAIATQAGKKDDFDAAQREYTAFETEGTLPTVVPTAEYENRVQQARKRVSDAYTRAIQALYKANLDEAVATTRSEFARWRAPDDAKEFAGRYYKCFSQELTWHEAQARCVAMGGHLVVIDSEDENGFVNQLVEAAGCKVVWLGATDEVKEGNWVWLDGQRMQFSKWGPEEPKTQNNAADYLVLSLESGTSWQAHTDRWLHAGLVCEWD